MIEYIDHEGKVSPAIEGRIAFGPVVGDTDDAGAGSLRAAIKEANERPGADMIVFDDVEGTISLATSLPTITDDVIITGPGAGDLAISGNGRRILSVAEGATVTISGFSFRNGAAGRGAGGAIANAGELTLDGVRFLDNAATYGGAVDNTGSLTVRDTTFSGNEAVAAGGAISSDGTLVIERSTFSDNAAGLSGGALDSSGTLTATNATFAANAAGNKGGAIYVAGGESTLTNLTVSGNRVLNPGATGGGLHLAAGVVDLRATIVANSTAGGDCVKAGGATIRTDVDNLVEDGSCATGSTSRATGDPNLGALAANGGPTRTMALHVPSPAIDAADNGSCPAVDQRGSTRARSLGDPCDIGAFEATDRALPIVTVPGVTPNTGATIRASGLAVSVAWNGSDVGSGVASYEVERSIAGGAWTTVKAGLTTPVLVTRVPFTGTARFRVRAIDAAGNIGAWAYGPTLTASLIQQTDHAIRYNEPWTTSRSDRYSGGSVLWADDKGDYATFTFTGRGVAVVSTLAPSRGRVRVYVDGTYRATVDLHAASVTGRVVVWQGTWAKSATRTIKLVVAGTAGRPRVDLDAFVVVK